MKKINLLKQMIAGLVLSTSTVLAMASDSWPNRPVQIVVPIDAGTLHDTVARRLATSLSTKWNQPVNVVNQPGGGSAIGTLTVANSAPDGYTLGLVSATLTGSLATRNNLPYTRDKLTGVVRFARQEFVIFANKNAPFDTVQQMVEYARTNPGKLDYASPAIGSYVNITMEHLATVKNLKLVHVPYRNLMQAAPDVVSGRIHLLVTGSNSALEGLVSKGDMKVIGGLGRTARYLDMPIGSLSSVAPDVHASGVFGLIAASGTPKSITDKIHKDVSEIIATPEFRQTMQALGSPVDSAGVPGEYDRWIDAEVDKLKKIIARADIKIE